MNGSTATSFALSFLLVAVVAVVFYQPDRLPPHAVVAGASKKAEEPKKPAAVKSSKSRPDSIPPSETPKAATPSPIKSPTVATRRPPAPFTTVEPGESLADVAARIYGQPERADILLRANRDQLDRLEESPPTGTILRTPEATDLENASN